MRRVFDPPGQALDDHAIFAGIAAKLGIGELFTEERSPRAWLEHIVGNSGAVRCRHRDLHGAEVLMNLVRAGYGDCPPPRVRSSCWMLSDPIRMVIHCGRQVAGSRFTLTRSSPFGYANCPPSPTWLEPSEWLGSSRAGRYPLHMLSDQPHNKLHSQLDFSPLSRASKVRGREPVWIHPIDAAARNISDGDVVRLFNDRGSCLAGARVTDAIMAGVVKLSTGAWWDPEEPGVPGSLDKHGNPNVLTRDCGTSSLGQGCAAQSCLVQLESYKGVVPPVTAFDLPRIVPLTG